MPELETRVHDTQNGLSYTLHGDYYFPDLELPVETRPIGKYGAMRFQYLKDHRPGLFAQMVLGGELDKHLAEVNELVHERLDRLIPQMAAIEGVNERLKEDDQLAWVARMNSILSRAEEIVCPELIYG